IGTANYTFLNYLVLSLGFLLLDDRFCERLFKRGWLHKSQTETAALFGQPAPAPAIPRPLHPAGVAARAVILTWIFYVTTVELIDMFWPRAPLPTAPVAALEPFRIANRYGLFAVMTRGRYEIEFQGSNDGQNWTPYLFRYKPQAVNEAPRIYAPYQPRFDWNLWFASLGSWRDNMFVASVEERLLNNDHDVLNLFRFNPFPNAPPKQVRAVLWQYWFTSMAEKRATGNWWKREYLGTYAPTLTQNAEGKLVVLEWPTVEGPRE
ncbi:MAG: membrane protein, partial [Proteobacteria bacterium]